MSDEGPRREGSREGSHSLAQDQWFDRHRDGYELLSVETPARHLGGRELVAAQSRGHGI